MSGTLVNLAGGFTNIITAYASQASSASSTSDKSCPSTPPVRHLILPSPLALANPNPSPGTQVNVTIWSTIEPSTGILSACLPIMGPLLRIKLTDVRSLSWFGRSSSGSPRDGCAAAECQIDLQMPEKALSRETSAGDEEMATAPREVQPVAKD